MRLTAPKRVCGRNHVTEYVSTKVCVYSFPIPRNSFHTHAHAVTHMYKAVSGDTALMAMRVYCENRKLYALLVLNKARGSEL